MIQLANRGWVNVERGVGETDDAQPDPYGMGYQ
jgi:hypothetical protein